MNDFWSVISEKKIEKLKKLHKITHNSVKNINKSGRGLPNARNIYTKCVTNLCIGLRDKVKNGLNQDLLLKY